MLQQLIRLYSSLCKWQLHPPARAHLCKIAWQSVPHLRTGEQPPDWWYVHDGGMAEREADASKLPSMQLDLAVVLSLGRIIQDLNPLAGQYRQLSAEANRGRLCLEYAEEGDEISAIIEPGAFLTDFFFPRDCLLQPLGAFLTNFFRRDNVLQPLGAF